MQKNLEVIKILNRLIKEATESGMDNINILTKYAEEIDKLYSDQKVPVVTIPNPYPVYPMYPQPYEPNYPWRLQEFYYTTSGNKADDEGNNTKINL